MIKSYSNIGKSLLLGLCFFMTACVNEDGLYLDDNDKWNEEKPHVSLIITPLAEGSAQGEVQERVRTLRIIMLSDGYLEANKFIDLTETFVTSGELASTFVYRYSKVTVPGNKKFYLIANEESVPQITFAGGTTLPDGLSDNMSLKALLNSFKEETNLEESTLSKTGESGAEFERIINSVIFKPNFEVENGSVFLPYSAYYEGYSITKDMEPNEDKLKELRVDMHLVPACVKFNFNVTNNRKNDVTIESIEIHKLNQSQYLLAKVDDTEKTNPDNSKILWWIDWLADCNSASQHITPTGSQTYDDALAEFTLKWGYIDSFSIPDKDDLDVKEIIPQGSKPKLDKLFDIRYPSSWQSSTLYLSESKSLYKLETSTTENDEDETHTEYSFTESSDQHYYLKFKFSGENAEDAHEEYVEIGYLNSLFRATHVNIDLKIYESYVDIYAEIAPWNTSLFLGYIEKEEDE